MAFDPQAPRILLVGSREFRELASSALLNAEDQPACISSRESLSDLDEWDQDLVVFRLSSHEPHLLDAALSFLARKSRAEAIVVVSEGEEDLGIGAVARGAMNFIFDQPKDFHTLLKFARQAIRRRRTPNPKAALERFDSQDVFSTVCHPIIDLQDQKAIGWEFLSRGPHGPMSQPARFFRWGREHDRLIEFDLACFEAAIKVADEHQMKGRLHLNLFSQTLMSPEIEKPLAKLKSLGLGQTCIEISETDLATIKGNLEKERAMLKSMKIDLAIDDIGFQARGLGMVRRIAPQVLKIDRRVTSNIVRHQSKRDIVSATLKFGATLGAMVIMEGVEFDSELEVLQQLGVRYAQGFYWGKPNLPHEASMSARFRGKRQENS